MSQAAAESIRLLIAQVSPLLAPHFNALFNCFNAFEQLLTPRHSVPLKVAA